MLTHHRIVIVGGGAGGLELATRLGNDFGQRGIAKIILVDQKTSHIWKPLYHEIAAGSLDVAKNQCDYARHAAKHHYEFVHARLKNIDTLNKRLVLHDAGDTVAIAPSVVSSSEASLTATSESISYDTLVLALGSVSHDFAIAGVQQYAYFLDQQHQAQHLQQVLQSKLNDLPRIAIVGAGATGVELAAQLKIRQSQAPVYLIEAAARILPSYTPKMSAYAQAQLEQMGVQLYTAHSVAEVQAQQLLFTNCSSLRNDLCIWTAGIQAPAIFAEFSHFERDHLNRIKVNASLQSVSHHDVFAIGDCAHCQTPNDAQPLGARAQVASQQAEFLHGALRTRLSGKRLPQFKFLDKGSLINLNHLSAVGELFQKVPVQGAVAKSLYLSLYPLHLANIHGVTKAGLLSARYAQQQFLPWLKSNLNRT